MVDATRGRRAVAWCDLWDDSDDLGDYARTYEYARTYIECEPRS